MSDYIPKSGTLVFEPGQTRKAIEIDVLDDAFSELDEFFKVILSSPEVGVLGKTEGIITIKDDYRLVSGEVEFLDGQILADLEDVITMGEDESSLGAGNEGFQPEDYHGVSIPVAVLENDPYTIQFLADLYTWDSYTAPGSNTGYWDGFKISVTHVPYKQWIDGKEEPLVPEEYDQIGFNWGGNTWGDAMEDADFADQVQVAEITADDLTLPILYLNIGLDTITGIADSDTKYPSWGTFTFLMESLNFDVLLDGAFGVPAEVHERNSPNRGSD